MIAVILNSGMGKRLGEITRNKPKGLIPIHDKETLFSHQIKLLKKVHINKFVITTGYMETMLMEYAEKMFPDTNFVFVHNAKYESTNYIVSLNNARTFINDDFLLLHGDLFFEYSVLLSVAQSQKSAVVVDSTLPLPEKDFKATIQDDRVVKISTTGCESGSVACQPFYKLFMKDWILWEESIAQFCASGKTDVYAEEALNSISSELAIGCIDVRGRICQEVDTPHDWEQVKTIMSTSEV
jgi:phosphoenolpyruvate phosphomutase